MMTLTTGSRYDRFRNNLFRGWDLRVHVSTPQSSRQEWKSLHAGHLEFVVWEATFPVQGYPAQEPLALCLRVALSW